MAEAEQENWELEAGEQADAAGNDKYRRSIYSVPVTVTVSIGRMRLSVSEVLGLEAESVVPLTSRIDDPVDLTVDNKVIAKGELIETGSGGLAVRLTEIMEQSGDDAQ